MGGIDYYLGQYIATQDPEKKKKLARKIFYEIYVRNSRPSVRLNEREIEKIKSEVREIVKKLDTEDLKEKITRYVEWRTGRKPEIITNGYWYHFTIGDLKVLMINQLDRLLVHTARKLPDKEEMYEYIANHRQYNDILTKIVKMELKREGLDKFREYLRKKPWYKRLFYWRKKFWQDFVEKYVKQNFDERIKQKKEELRNKIYGLFDEKAFENFEVFRNLKSYERAMILKYFVEVCKYMSFDVNRTRFQHDIPQIIDTLLVFVNSKEIYDLVEVRYLDDLRELRKIKSEKKFIERDLEDYEASFRLAIKRNVERYFTVGKYEERVQSMFFGKDYDGDVEIIIRDADGRVRFKKEGKEEWGDVKLVNLYNFESKIKNFFSNYFINM